MDVAFRSSLLAVLGVLGISRGVQAAEFEPQATLSATEQRFGVAAHFEEDRIHLWSCDPGCKSAEPSLTLEIPAQMGKGPRRVETLRTKKGSALWIQLGPQENFYSLIVVGPPRGENAGAAPSLILKGWAGEQSDSKTTFQRSKKNGEDSLSVLVAASPAACGRQVPLTTRMLDLEQGRFLTVRGAVLSAAERESAVRLVARAVDVTDKLLLALSASGDRSATELVDGDRETPWDEGYEFIELKAPGSVDLGEIILEVAQPLQEERTLSLVTATRAYQVVLPSSAEKTYSVKIPEEKDLCVALIQPRSPAPVSEVMVAASSSEETSTAALVQLLEKSDPGNARAALFLRGNEAARELAGRFYSMSPLARGRALELAAHLSGGAGVPVFIAAIESGDAEQSETALEALNSSGAPGVQALEERLQGAVVQTEEKLISALMRVSPSRAAHVLPSLLEGASPGRRSVVRAALSKLSSDQAARQVLKELLRDLSLDGPGENASQTSLRQTLSSDAQVELVRALSPLLAEESGAERFISRLAQDADFSRAYYLAPHVATLAGEDRNLQRILSNWLGGRASGKLSAAESAALSVHVLEVLRDLENKELTRRYEPQVGKLLTSENMRVKEAALLNLAGGDSRVGRERAKQFLVRDDWPQVRAAAAAVVATEERDEVERLLARRLVRDPHEGVRRAVAQALARTGGETAILSLRRAFAKDESYAVRAEAALSLGKLCDTQSLDALTHTARKLTSGMLEDGPIELGLASVTALAYLRPSDIEQRLAPLLSEKTPGITRQQVKKRLDMVRTSRSGPVCSR